MVLLRRHAPAAPALLAPGAACLLLCITTFNLVVAADVPGLRFQRHPESAIVLPGAEVTFECALNVSADRVEWRHRGQPQPVTGNRSSGRLVVHVALQPAEYTTQIGTYQCVAWFGASALASLPAELQVATLEASRQPPQEPTVYKVAPGNVVVLRCPPPNSIPPAQVKFQHDGKPISARVSETGSFLLNNVTQADAGLYTCSATNPLTGQTVALPQTMQLKVEVPSASSTERFPHILSPRVNNYTVLAGKDAMLECPAVGLPVPHMTWTKYGGSIPRDRATMVPGALVLSAVTQADEGTYVCEVTNGLGPATSCVNMLHVLEPPSIVIGPVSMTVEEGSEVRLECSVKGRPVPLISWVQNGELVDKDPLINAKDGKLVISQVEKRHAGIFQCFASSSQGSAFGLAMLQVSPKPITSRPHGNDDRDHGDFHYRNRGHKENRGRGKKKKEHKFKGNAVMVPPTRPNITRLSDESVMVRWSVPADEGLPILFFKVQYRDLNDGRGSQWRTIDDDIPPHIRSYEVDTLKTDSSYRFRIAAVYSNNDNKLGPTSVRFLLQKEPTTKKPLFPPTLAHGEAISPSAIEIEWEYTEVPSTPIEGFFIYYRSTTMAGDYTKATVIGENTRAYLITHLLPDNSYDIKMQSFNMAGTSDFSAIRSYRTQYVPTTAEPGGSSIRSPVLPGGGSLSGVNNQESGGNHQLGLVLGIVLGGLVLLLVMLSLGVYLCRNSNARNNSTQHEPEKEVQAYGLAAVGKPLTNGTSHHLHQLHHRHLASPRVHITANPLASAGDHYKSDEELEVARQNNNCAALLEPARRRRPGEDDDNEDLSEEGDEEPPPAPPRSHSENYV